MAKTEVQTGNHNQHLAQSEIMQIDSNRTPLHCTCVECCECIRASCHNVEGVCTAILQRGNGVPPPAIEVSSF